MRRTLGHSGIEVSAMGLGCWAIGGPFLFDGKPDGWGRVDDAESIRAIQTAIDLGVTFFDTADVYGTGHSERVLGEAIRGRRDQVVIATKFGYTYDESAKEITGTDVSPGYIRRACEASLRRLQVNEIDLYQLHPGEAPAEREDDIWAVLEDLKAEGKIRAYGWSLGSAEAAERFARNTSGVSIQHSAHIFHDPKDLFDAAERHGLANVINSPLAMGLLTGKFTADSQLPADDVRAAGHSWVPFFEGGRPVPGFLAQLDAVREILRSGGRTLAQGALAYLWARSERAIPIPGFKSVKQAEENAGAMAFGPLSPEQVEEIRSIVDGMVKAS